MRRVSYNNVRARHVLHHTALRHLLLTLLDFGLDLRVAFHLLVFFLDLLLGHLELFLKLPPLKQEIRRRNKHQHNANQHYKVINRQRRVRKPLHNARVHKRENFRKPRSNFVVNHHADNDYLDKPL